jgi:glucoselysine-6-phosphate deglycase
MEALMAIIPNNQAMLDEISEEPELFSRVLNDKEYYTKDFVQLFIGHTIKKIIFLGSGSPSHLSQTLKYAAIKLLKVDACCVLPSLFNHHQGFDPAGSYSPDEILLICPVESGRTKGPVLAARKARQLGIRCVCTTLNANGILAAESDVVLVKPSGEEKAPPTTKGHSTGLFMLLLCMVEAARAVGTISESEYTLYMQGFNGLVRTVRTAKEKSLKWFDANQKMMMKAANYWFLGYGANYGTTQEAVLKFIESHQKPTFGYELEEFLHGPLCAVKPDDVVFFLAAEHGPERERMLLLHSTMKKSYPHCVLVQTADGALRDPNALTLDSVNLEFLNCLEFLAAIQVLSFEIADKAGVDVTVWTTKPIREIMQPSFALQQQT